MDDKTTTLTDFQLNKEKKLKKLAENANAIKIGGKGTVRRKKKIIHRPPNADDKKLQGSLKKLAANNIQGIEEVNMFKDNGEVIHFSNPKVQASLSSNTFAISGQSDTKSLTEMLPSIISQLGADNIWNAGNKMKLPQRLAGDNKTESGNIAGGNGATATGDGQEDDEDVPDLVEDFDKASKE
ncbi:unnamed protein product [Didymodactylos carnosus]|uniref:Transcription factor BTF3 n=1 Tax=Didymodactylos carnosus TaxID=1234261 RepID=A0A814H3Y7_9BILA|nr:unnamed protein product [Didymodactylos carnosus]CAF1005466.1 unnamed protein product [Didymodactylos carnosus]CAF3651905.1 unnamed protein product [Didymodactylos carnosus]CAF3776816.1 unnamed protein product [Didymodactylos carnosus]